MHGGLLKYGAIVAKLRSLHGNLFKYEDFVTMSKMEKVSDAVRMLKERTIYGHELQNTDLHRDVIEQKLKYGYFDKVLRIELYLNKNDRKFISAVMSKYEIDVLKKVMRNCLEDKPAENSFLYDIPGELIKIYDFDIKKLAAAENVQDVLSVIRKTKYYPVLSVIFKRDKAPEIFEVETNLDIFYFKELQQTVMKCYAGEKQEKIEEFIGTRADIFNILWIYRCKRYYKLAPEFIYALLLPVYGKLNPAKIKNLVQTDSLAELEEFILNTKYAECFNFNDTALFEKLIRKTIIKRLNEMVKKNPYSISSVLLYLHKEELELENICSVIEGIRYGLPSEKILEYVVM